MTHDLESIRKEVNHHEDRHAPLALSVRGLCTEFRSGRTWTPVVRGIDVDLAAGRTLAILGESGSGKSVSARSILRLYGKEARHSGSVQVHGQEVLGATERELCGLRGSVMSLVSQDPTSSLDPLRRIGHQLGDTVKAQRGRLPHAQLKERVTSLLASVGILDTERVAQSHPHQLSGGMRQRISIALAVSRSPKLLVADEPTTALDPTVTKQVLGVFAELQRTTGMALVFVTHDVGVARAIADEVAVMFNGRFVEYGPAKQVLTAPAHPYTAALLAAVPGRHSVRGKLPTVAETLSKHGIDYSTWDGR